MFLRMIFLVSESWAVITAGYPPKVRNSFSRGVNSLWKMSVVSMCGGVPLSMNSVIWLFFSW